MSSIRDLDTLSLRQLYYLLSIDLRSILSESIVSMKGCGKVLARQLCQNAFDSFGLELDEDEISVLFIQPLVDHLQLPSTGGCAHVQGEYFLSVYHLEFNSSVALFLSASGR